MIKVTNDLFDIANRIKKINPAYRVFYNNKEKRFEVHTTALEFIVPFESLDSRTLEHARKTLVQNADVFWQEMEERNNKSKDFSKENVELLSKLEYARRTGHDVTFTKNHIKEY